MVLLKRYDTIKIPAGDASLTVYMVYKQNRLYEEIVYKAEGMEFDYSFEGGKKYSLSIGVRRPDGSSLGIRDLDDDDLFGVDIYDQFPGAIGGGYPEGSYLGFIPFKDQPTEWKRSLF